MRSIPACAGEPAFSSHTQGLSPRVRGNLSGKPSSRGLFPVYPRVCGGTPLAAKQTGRVSYPRVCGGTRICKHRLAVKNWVYPRVCGGTKATGGVAKAA